MFKDFPHFRDFVFAVARHWGSLVSGGFLIGVLGIFQGTGHAVPAWVYWLVAIVALFVACFRAWLEERKAKEKVLASMGVQGSFNDAWLALYNEKKSLENELDSLELPEPASDIKNLPLGVMPVVRFMTQYERYQSERRDRRIRRIRDELRTLGERLKSVPQKYLDKP
jgi:hypothetical protein